MTIKESYPFERGKSVMRSTKSCLKRKEVNDFIGESGGVTG
jgi:hypothetical protein